METRLSVHLDYYLESIRCLSLRHQEDRHAQRSSKQERNTSKDTRWANTVVDSPQDFLFFNIVRGKILYITCLSFIVYMSFIYDGDEKGPFESLISVLIFPLLLSHRNWTQPKFKNATLRPYIVREMVFHISLCILILYILPFVCMVLVCLWSPLKWLYQSNLGDLSTTLKLIDSPKMWYQ